ncbi:hypothetical protein scyTo_0017277 [Scyliorhinus torazame]|uniref:Uncharacterized protein n=1 Tax=Scyliorhinus torazame TaxID=75743 RepID=A0A401Q5P1_SCYTO|nr:hypothetical protein [Scyliorhinus torazame]
MEPMKKLQQMIVEMDKQIGLEDITELLVSHGETVSTEDLKEIKDCRRNRGEDNEQVKHPGKTLSSKSLGDALKKAEEAIVIFDEEDPDREHSSRVNRSINNAGSSTKKRTKQKYSYHLKIFRSTTAKNPSKDAAKN